METIKKTFQEIKDIDSVVSEIYKRNPKIEDQKFGYWYKKFIKKNFEPTYTLLNEAIYDLKLENALVDQTTKEILFTDNSRNNFKFSREGMKRVVEGTRKLNKEYDAKEIEVIPCISSEVPENLTDEEKEALTGLLI